MLQLDADARVPPVLADEIPQVIADPTARTHTSSHCDAPRLSEGILAAIKMARKGVGDRGAGYSALAIDGSHELVEG